MDEDSAYKLARRTHEAIRRSGIRMLPSIGRIFDSSVLLRGVCQGTGVQQQNGHELHHRQ